MLSSFYLRFGENSVATVIIPLAIMMAGGYLMTKLTGKLKLPNVTAYIVTGILIGPFVLDLIPEKVVKGSAFLSDIALAIIAFTTGEFFKVKALKRNGPKVLVITLCEAMAASILVFILTYFILHLNLPFSIVISALASATAPASTLMTIRQTRAKGDFVDTLLQVVALDDVVGLVAYSVAISVAVSVRDGSGFDAASILKPVLLNLGVIVLGGLFGAFLSYACHAQQNNSDNRLVIVIAFLLGFCGICAAFDVSPLLGCMAMSTVFINISKDEKLFKQLNYFSPPILLMFFVRSGVNFDLNALIRPSGSIGSVPLLTIGILYFLVRIAGKYAGAYAGSTIVGKRPEVRKYLGLALIPQAGVAIGLAALGARTLGGEMGNALETIILASSVLYELVGPACGKLALYLSGSFGEQRKENQ